METGRRLLSASAAHSRESNNDSHAVLHIRHRAHGHAPDSKMFRGVLAQAAMRAR